MQIKNWIDGKLSAGRKNQWLDNFEPATGKVYSQVVDSTEEDVEEAVRAAARAFPAWRDTPVRERARILRNISELILKNKNDLVAAESRDQGKTVRLARELDIPRSAWNFEFFSEEILNFHGQNYQDGGHTLAWTRYEPLGVVACISPWNLPLYLLTWKIAPALAAGNTVVAKPSELTPLTAGLLGELTQEAGLPKGVLNILHGRGPTAGETLCRHREVKAVSFTGSTLTGRKIQEMCAPQFKKTSLELGGKNATLVFSSAFKTADSREQTLSKVLRSAFLNQGEICLCGSRILVEKSIYNEFKEAFVQKARDWKVGDPSDEKSDMGPLVSKPHWEKVKSFVDLAKKDGAKFLLGGSAPELTGGYFFSPTIVEGLSPEHPCNQEEVFGPFVTLIPFSDEAEALRIANGTRYGLAFSVWTQDLDQAHRISNQLQTGIVWINQWMQRDLRTPFGGVKESGMGREGGLEALRFFSEIKTISMALSQGGSV